MEEKMTPALIGFLEEGRVYTMCMDRDGYPSWAGWQLLSQYNSFALAKKLVLYDDMVELSPTHPEGEQKSIRVYDTVMTALLHAVCEEIGFAYVFEGEHWMFYNLSTDIRYPGSPLNEAIIADPSQYEG
jgi:hypothetical protein